MTEKKNKVVTHRPKGDRKPERPISEEPEMKELKRMIRDGELDPGRTLEEIRKNDAAAADQEPKGEQLPAFTPGDWILTLRTTGGGTRKAAVRIVRVHRDGLTVSSWPGSREYLWIPKTDIVGAEKRDGD